MPRRDVVKFEDCRVVAVSQRTHSVLVEHEDWDEPIWFPDSQIDDDSEIYSESLRNDEGTLIVTEWIAKQKGIVNG